MNKIASSRTSLTPEEQKVENIQRGKNILQMQETIDAIQEMLETHPKDQGTGYGLEISTVKKPTTSDDITHLRALKKAQEHTRTYIQSVIETWNFPEPKIIPLQEIPLILGENQNICDFNLLSFVKNISHSKAKKSVKKIRVSDDGTEISYQYLGNLIKYRWQGGEMVTVEGLPEEEIHATILEKLSIQKQKIPGMAKHLFTISADIALQLSEKIKDEVYVIRSLKIHKGTGGHTALLVPLRNYEDIHRAKEESKKNLIGSDRPSVELVEIPDIYVRLHHILQNKSL